MSQAIQKRMIETYNYGFVPKDELLAARAAYLETIVQKGFTVDPRNMEDPIVFIGGELFAHTYRRIVTSAYGSYMEFQYDDLAVTELTVPIQHLWRTDPTYRINGKLMMHKYIHYEFNGVMIFYQIRSVSYADYRNGKFYVSIYNIDAKE